MVTVLVSAALAVLVVMMLGAITSRVLNLYAIVDVVWALAFAAGAVAALVASIVAGVGETWRSALVVALVLAWAVRLGVHLGRRTFTADEDDPRYLDFMGGSAREVPFVALLTKVYVLQGVLVLVVGYAVFASTALEVRWAWAAIVGVVVWAFGLVFEAVADRQLTVYRATPREERDPVLSTGLWAWSRHPNYFGEAVIWWGVWFVAGLASGPVVALWTLPAPIALTLIVTAVSGVRIAERRMRDRPGWADYAARTPIFIPRPPRTE